MKHTLAVHAACVHAACALAACSALAVHAEAAPPAAGPLQGLAFLAGHCFKGALPGGADVDEHCFQWLYGGKALRDVHKVQGSSHADYVGETTYYWDSAANRIEYLYIENAGGVMRGTVEPASGALIFPAATYVADGRSMTLRVRWTLLPGQAYEAWSEVQGKEGWTTMFRVKMARSS